MDFRPLVLSLFSILSSYNNDPGNNGGRGPGEVDLHGLYVKEAIARTESAIQAAQRNNLSEIKLIVGKTNAQFFECNFSDSLTSR